MNDSIKTLLNSKRAMVLVASLVAAALMRFVGLPEAEAALWAERIVTAGFGLAGSITATDVAKAWGKPAGTGHKPDAVPAPVSDTPTAPLATDEDKK